MRKILTFSGQGSQSPQMGKRLYQRSQIFREWVNYGDEIVRKHSGFSLLKMVYGGAPSEKDPLESFHISHPVLFITQYAAAQMILEKDPSVNAVFGFSLGEIVAFAVSECCRFEDLLVFLLKQVEWISSTTSVGKLIVVVGLKNEIDHALALCKDKYEHAISFGPMSHTISLQAKFFPDIEDCLRLRKLPWQDLKVSYPFHSQWIESCKRMVMHYAEHLSFSPPKKELLSCLMQDTHEKVVDSSYLWDLIRMPLDVGKAFQRCVKKEDIVIDCSPNGSIYGLSLANGYRNSHNCIVFSEEI